MKIEVSPCALEDLEEKEVFLQSSFWARFKAPLWKSYAFFLQNLIPKGSAVKEKEIEEKEKGSLLVLVRTVSLGPLKITFGYVGWGPRFYGKKQEVFGEIDRTLNAKEAREYSQLIVDTSLAMKKFLPKECVFLRYELPLRRMNEEKILEEQEKKDFFSFPLQKAPINIQPPSTVLTNLQKGSFEEVLESLKKKTRYNIRLSSKKNLVIRVGTFNDLKEWYELYQETAQRDLIVIHAFPYYEKLWREIEGSGFHLLFLRAFYAEKLLAGILVLMAEKRATYLYGASSREHKERMPMYALQAKALEICFERGLREYDWGGIPPQSEKENDSMKGLFQFKSGFGETENRLGSVDMVFKKKTYALFSLLERGRNWYFKKMRRFWVQKLGRKNKNKP